MRDTTATPPPTKAAETGKTRAFVHDGFYLRLALGPALTATSLRTDRVASPDASMTGFGAAIDAWLGWTIASGLVIGPSLSGASHQAGSARIGDERGKLEASRTLIGVFLDAYPNPQRGFHFGGILAAASLRVTGGRELAFQTFTGGGMGLEVFAGYEAFIARDWSAGGVLRLGGVFGRSQDAVPNSNERVTRQATSFSAALLATLVYH